MPPNSPLPLGTSVALLITMAPALKMALSEVQLLQREIEAQGEWLNRERLERKAEVDELRTEIEAMRRTLARLVASFESVFQEESEIARHQFNPER